MGIGSVHLGFDSPWFWLALCGCALATYSLAGPLPRHPRRRLRVGRLISFISLSMALHPTASDATTKRLSVTPAGGAPQGQPWSGPSEFPPPLPLARTMPRPLHAGVDAEASSSVERAVHPAIHHGGRDQDVVPLFPRADRSDERAASMARHPSGRDLKRQAKSSHVRPTGARLHVVRQGESLWTIAAAQLNSDDPARIARYWHRIYLRNRKVIGGDPDLIRSGQLLQLPVEIDV